jgi:hypothetical protein
MSVSLDSQVIYSTNDWLSHFAISRQCTKIRECTTPREISVENGLSFQLSGLIFHITLIATSVFCSLSSVFLITSLALCFICVKSDLREIFATSPGCEPLIEEMRRRSLAS